MRIIIGSQNPIKVQAVREVFGQSGLFSDATISSLAVQTGVSNQPTSLEDIISGARNRAKNAFSGCDLAVGLESGFMKVPFTKTGYMEICACALYDGKQSHIGLSQSFECPPKIMKLVLDEKIDLTEACNRTGLSANTELGKAEGLIGILTRGKVTRKEYTKQALLMALIHLENAELYRT